MADSFNPQEILARLRAKPVASAPPPPLASPNGSFMLSGGSSRLAGSKKQLSPPAKNVPPPTPVNQELAEANPRQELEKEITRLQAENANFRKENKQLRMEKEELERNFVEFKSKAEDTIAKLRGKLAVIAFDSQPPAKPDLKVTGKLYRNNPIIPEPKQASTPSSRQGRSPERHLTPPDSGGFRDPTFSELMRRSTDEPLDFRESLRKPRNVKVNKAAPMHPHGGSQMLGSPSSQMEMMSPPQPPAQTTTVSLPNNANNTSNNATNSVQQMQQQPNVESKQISSSHHHHHHRNSSKSSLGGLGENMYPSFLSYGGGYPGGINGSNEGGFVEYDRSNNNNAFAADERRNTLRRTSSNASVIGDRGQAQQQHMGNNNNMSSANMMPFEGGEYSHTYRPNELPVLEVDLTR